MAQQFKAKLNPFTGQLQLVPTNIVLAFKAGVASQANLPLTGNAIGDARLANDTGHLYVWSIETSSGLLTDWVDAGDIVDLEWSAINGKPSSTPANIDDAVSKRHSNSLDHTQNTDLYLATQVGCNLYVDCKRTDTYTANGSITKPFKTIQAAINQVIANGNNDFDNFPYTIMIAAGTYVETVTLESDKLVFLTLFGEGSGAVTIKSPTVDGVALQSTTNNANLQELFIQNIEFQGGISLIGDVAATTFANGGFYFDNVTFNANGSNQLYIDVCNYVTIINSIGINIPIIIGNVSSVWFENIRLIRYALDIAVDYVGTLEPSSYIEANGTGVTFKNVYAYVTPTITFYQPGSNHAILAIYDSMVGQVTETLTIPAGTTVSGRNSAIYSIISNSGVLSLQGVAVRKSITNDGTLTLSTSFAREGITTVPPGTTTFYQPGSQINNDSTVSGTTVKDALETLDSTKTTLALVKADADIADALSKKHAAHSDDQVASEVNTDESGKTVQDHIDDVSNPHSVTKTQVGLGNVDNKSEATIITDVKADSDVASAISLKHTQNTDTVLKLADSGNPDLINDGTLKENLAVDALKTIDGRDISVDGGKLDTIELNAVSLSTVKSDTDIDDAIDKKHAAGSDNQTAAQVDTDETGKSVQDKIDDLDAVAHTHANKAVLDNVSGTNTGDETAARIATIITGAGVQTTPLDADEFPFYKIVGTILSKVTWTNIKATLKAYFDNLYIKEDITSYDEKVSPDNADLIPIFDSDSPGGIKKVQVGNLPGGSAAPTRGTFVNGDLAAGILTITHSKGLSAPYSLVVVIFDNNGKQIIPDEITGAADSVAIDLSSFGAITGTWGYAYLA